MTVDQKEHCGSGNKYSGAGFKMIIHDKNIKQPFFDIVSYITPISLSPGFQINVALKQISFNRQTEHLRYCNSPKYQSYNGTKVYVLQNNLCSFVYVKT